MDLSFKDPVDADGSVVAQIAVELDSLADERIDLTSALALKRG